MNTVLTERVLSTNQTLQIVQGDITTETVDAIVNAANEVAVAGFLAGRLNFTGIPKVIEAVMTKATTGPIGTIDDVLCADREARALTREQLA